MFLIRLMSLKMKPAGTTNWKQKKMTMAFENLVVKKNIF